MLRRVHLVGAWGRGVPLIIKKEPAVDFKEIAKLFITSFARPSFLASPELTNQETIVKDFSTTEQAIISMIAANPSVTQKEMADRLNLSEVGIRYHTDKLKAKEILQRRVKKRSAGGTRWGIFERA